MPGAFSSRVLVNPSKRWICGGVPRGPTMTKTLPSVSPRSLKPSISASAEVEPLPMSSGPVKASRLRVFLIRKRVGDDERHAGALDLAQ